jgi:hypothetical protein
MGQVKIRMHGNLNNRLAEVAKPKPPEVGMGATILMYSDRHAATIIEIVSPKEIIIQQDISTRMDKNGQSESQEYSYLPDPNAKKETFTLRKTGQWIRCGDSLRSGTVLQIGERDEYYDPSF